MWWLQQIEGEEGRREETETLQDVHHSRHDNWECSEVFLTASQYTAPVKTPTKPCFLS